MTKQPLSTWTSALLGFTPILIAVLAGACGAGVGEGLQEPVSVAVVTVSAPAP